MATSKTAADLTDPVDVAEPGSADLSGATAGADPAAAEPGSAGRSSDPAGGAPAAQDTADNPSAANRPASDEAQANVADPAAGAADEAEHQAAAPDDTPRAYVVLLRDHGAFTAGAVLDLPADIAGVHPEGENALLRPATDAQVEIARPRIVRLDTL